MAVTIENCPIEDVQVVGQEFEERITIITGGGDTTATIGTSDTAEALKLRKILRIKAVPGVDCVIAANKKTVAITGLTASKRRDIVVRGI